MEDFISLKLQQLCHTAQEVARQHIAPRAEEVDVNFTWPAHSLQSLAAAGLTGLHIPARLGGHEQGLLALALITEVIGKACSSSALCFGMHCVGSAVMAAKATPDQEERYLRPIAGGQHITTLSLSEAGTGVHFYLPQTQLKRRDGHFEINGTKQFVTNGGHADSYVLSTTASIPTAEAGEFSCLIVDSGTPGLTWLEPWRGFGMHGNSSRGLHLQNARVPLENLLGEEGDEIWYIFEVVAPYFLIAMAATYLGVAQAALDATLQHLRSREYQHSAERLSDVPVIQHKVAEMWTTVEKTRHLVYNAARLGDLGDAQALVSILAAKADAGDTAVWATNEAMTLCGGMAYRENSQLARLLRDARASHVMSPTTDILKQWAGRALLGMPLL